MQFSKFGEKFSQPSAIKLLMQDMSEAHASKHPDLCMLGGGNPANIEPAQALLEKELALIVQSGEFQQAFGTYDGPQGGAHFIEILCDYLNRELTWNISPENISLTNGSQNSFFYLFNTLAGEMPDGSFKKVLFPLSPEYVGYADSGLHEDMFCSVRPTIELLDNRQFKYRIDFDNLKINDDIAAICLSRPTNPTGNVVTDRELDKLNQLALQHNIPLIIDNAYGQPFPNVVYSDVNTPWNDNIIICMSLSKLGLPGARTGIVIANPQITQAMSSLSGIITLAPNSIGQALVTRLLQNQEMTHLSQHIIKPFYQQRLNDALRLFEQLLGQASDKTGSHITARIHKPEGAFFLWLWFEGLPISSHELYVRLKKRHVLVIPGEHFFIGIDSQWPHTQECLRINYAQPIDRLERGFTVLAEELDKLSLA